MYTVIYSVEGGTLKVYFTHYCDTREEAIEEMALSCPGYEYVVSVDSTEHF